MAEISEEELQAAANALAYYMGQVFNKHFHTNAARAAIETLLSGSTEYQRGFEDAKKLALDKCEGVREIYEVSPGSSWDAAITAAEHPIRALQPTER